MDDPRLAARLMRIAAAATAPPPPPPPPPPPTILLLEAPNHRREFFSRFPWNGGVSPYDPVDEVKQRQPRRRDLDDNWWER